MHILIGIIGIIVFLALAFYLVQIKECSLALCWIIINYSTYIRIYSFENDCWYYNYWWYFKWI